MVHIVIGDRHYVASEADIKEPNHNTPAGTLYQLTTAVRQPTLADEVSVLRDITRAENRQWLRRMVAAGVAAGASFELMRYLMGALFGQ